MQKVPQDKNALDNARSLDPLLTRTDMLRIPRLEFASSFLHYLVSEEILGKLNDRVINSTVDEEAAPLHCRYGRVENGESILFCCFFRYI